MFQNFIATIGFVKKRTTPVAGERTLTTTITVVNYLDPFLTGGVVTVIIGGTDGHDSVAITEGDTWTAGTSNNATATSLANAITNSGIVSSASLTATALANVITVVTDGNYLSVSFGVGITGLTNP